MGGFFRRGGGWLLKKGGRVLKNPVPVWRSFRSSTPLADPLCVSLILAGFSGKTSRNIVKLLFPAGNFLEGRGVPEPKKRRVQPRCAEETLFFRERGNRALVIVLLVEAIFEAPKCLKNSVFAKFEASELVSTTTLLLKHYYRRRGFYVAGRLLVQEFSGSPRAYPLSAAFGVLLPCLLRGIVQWSSAPSLQSVSYVLSPPPSGCQSIPAFLTESNRLKLTEID